MKKFSKIITFIALSIGFSVAYAGEVYCLKCDDIGCIRIMCPA